MTDTPRIPPLAEDEWSDEQRQLLKLHAGLDTQDRASLLAFAAFLAQRAGAQQADAEPPEPPEPKLIPRPAQETVIGALKRLSASYFMLDKSTMLNETANLMGAHIMQGREAREVIDELEVIFARQYRRLTGGDED